ncbi:MAG: hypothetical protein V4721_10215 [Bacteroidota bacterium]
MAVTRASKIISLTNYATGGAMTLSTNKIIWFKAQGSNTLIKYLAQNRTFKQVLVTDTVSDIHTATLSNTLYASQAITLTDASSTVLYVMSDRIIYMDDLATDYSLVYDEGSEGNIAPVKYTFSTPAVATLNTANGNTFTIVTQPTDSIPSKTRWINNLFVDQIVGEAVGDLPSITFTTKVKTGTGAVTTAGTGYTTLVAAITGGGGSGATGTVTGKAITGAVAAPGTGYVAGTSVITITGGTAATASSFTVTNTQVVSATVAAGGTGDLGAGAGVIVEGTTGTGTKFRASVTIAANAIASVQSITVAGNYTVEPTVIAAEPVTYISGAASGTTLTGAQLSVVMGALTLATNVAGNYSVLPANPAAQGSAVGGGTAATITVSWGILAFTITAAGTGYTSYPTFSVTGAGGTGGVITAAMQVETPMTIVDAGENLNTAPTLTFSATTGTLATATATLDAAAQNISGTTLTNAGSYLKGTDTYPSLAISGATGAQIIYDQKTGPFTTLQVEATVATVKAAINAL